MTPLLSQEDEGLSALIRGPRWTVIAAVFEGGSSAGGRAICVDLRVLAELDLGRVRHDQVGLSHRYGAAYPPRAEQDHGIAEDPPNAEIHLLGAVRFLVRIPQPS